MMLFFVILWSVVRHFPKNEICYFSNPVLLDIERNSSFFSIRRKGNVTGLRRYRRAYGCPPPLGTDLCVLSLNGTMKRHAPAKPPLCKGGAGGIGGTHRDFPRNLAARFYLQSVYILISQQRGLPDVIKLHCQPPIPPASPPPFTQGGHGLSRRDTVRFNGNTLESLQFGGWLDRPPYDIKR